MESNIEKQLEQIVEQTRKQNEVVGFKNIINNVYKFGYSNGKKSLDFNKLIHDTLINIFNPIDKVPTRDDEYVVVSITKNDKNDYCYNKISFVNGRWDCTDFNTKDYLMFWIDINELIKIKASTLKNE